MKILLTGGAGFIGSHTAVELINNGYEPVIIDDFRNSKPFILKNIEIVTGKKIISYAEDLGNAAKLREIIEKEKPLGVIHFAADKAVNESVLNPIKYYKNNVVNLIKLVEIIDEYNIKSFVFSSSCTVYGTPDHTPVSEESDIKPAFSPYGFTKQVGEQILVDYFKNKNKASLTILRYFNPIGAHPSALLGELPIGVPSNLIPFITQSASGKRGPLTVHGNDYSTPDGTCIRDYIHVVDLATAHVLALKKQTKPNRIYNVGVGKGFSVLEVLKSFEKVNSLKVNFQFGPRRSGDIPEIYANNNLIKKELAWSPKYSLENCLEHSWFWEQNLENF